MRSGLYIDGKWVAPVKGGTFEIINPATEEAIHRAAAASAEDVDLAVKAARHIPAFDKEIGLKVYSMKDEGTYATWKATKPTGQYDLKTFEVKARPVDGFEGLRPGMSLIIK